MISDGLFGFLAMVLAPMALALAYTVPGGAGWKFLTFLCCGGYLYRPSGVAMVALAQTFNPSMRMPRIRLTQINAPKFGF